jgi:hypothetical protein
MTADRMNREQFYTQLAGLDEQRLKKALWTLYWRGTAVVRERIEAELAPEEVVKQRVATPQVDPDLVLAEVRDFVVLARAGAYLGGDRRVSPKERTRWRFTFQRLVADATAALRAEDPQAGCAALEQLIDLACATRDYDYFRSEDPMEAARFVLSEAVAVLWTATRDHRGFSEFARTASGQLCRWESRYGWTRIGWGEVSKKETSLGSVLATMLRAPDTWLSFAEHYLAALDRAEPAGRDRRGADLAEWNLLLLDKLAIYEADTLLDRLAENRGLGGPALTHLQARLAHRRGDADRARTLATDCLQRLPGAQEFLDFATEIGAPMPANARRILRERQAAGAVDMSDPPSRR